ncbi:YidC/Oxa1 family membrane protein insertase [Rhodoligotrophos appendicifer]|uniref:membrane protein insertase YidC n=1 Tax=Rhodoligotrophos appendicifer TaxID=987056 RepID=UPI001185E772|nr:membrane protein insertase YidC [Rhodoligotrophos appendicifer]
MADNKQFILAIALSALVILVWQLFVGVPQMEKQQVDAPQQQQAERQAEASSTAPQITTPGASPAAPGTVAAGATPGSMTREQVIASTPRVAIETPSLVGSINLKGGRIDDLRLKKYHETVDPESPIITLLSPSGTSSAYFTESGWAAGGGTTVAVPTPETVWTVEGSPTLAPGAPVTLSYDNGQGQIFRRIVSVDNDYMFSIRQEVTNNGPTGIQLYPYALVSRTGTPHTSGFYILHEGPIGVLGEDGLLELSYKDLQEAAAPLTHSAVGGWLGITDKYWAVTIMPDPESTIEGRFFDHKNGTSDVYQSDFLVKDPVQVGPGATGGYQSQVFAGAKVVNIVERYAAEFSLDRFDLLIDWGWFYFITKPMFFLLEYIHGIVGNFGVAILITTVLVKLLFYPLANKSYKSMSSMKKLQPELLKIRERFPDDRMKQQEAMMALYKKEKVSPVSGCLPIVVQIPVFFALYKVLFVTIEMRHAPFFGWIKDLSAPDPTTIFNLFGLIPWTPPHMLMVGAWAIIMGITQWIQMRLNPAPPDPIQAKIFNWMPVFFTFLLASFPAGLVIYWSWNNTLSILQQWLIMRRQGVDVNLLGNIRGSIPFLNRGRKDASESKP